MKYTTFILLFTLLGLSEKAFAQQFKISGFVEDSKSGERLIGVNIFDLKSNKGTITNKYGFFYVSVFNKDSIKFQFSYIGYTSKIVDIVIYNDTLLNIKLEPAIEIEAIRVTASKKYHLEEIPEMSKIDIPLKSIRQLPSTIGEPDVLRVFQLMPGVQGGQEGSSGLFVRGGSPDQNLFLLDDVPLYNVSHLGGFVSVFDVSMLKSIDFYKGGFPSRYSGRLSSIVDLRLKDGNMKDFHIEYGIGTVVTKIMAEGPLQKNKSSFALSVRRCNFDALTWLQTKLFPDPLNPNDWWGYNFYDLNFKLNSNLSDNNRIYLSAYVGDDNLRFVTKKTESSSEKYQYAVKERLRWGNKMFSMRWNHIYNNQLFQNFTLSYAQYKYKNKYNYIREDFGEKGSSEDEEYLFFSGINDLMAKTDLEYAFGNQSIKMGAAGIFHRFTPAHASLVLTYHDPLDGDTTLIPTSASTQINAWESYGYIEYERDFFNKINANIGLNLNWYFAEKKAYFTPQPRLLLNYQFMPSWAIKASYGKMQQNVHLLTNSGAGLPTDLWVPSSSNIKPEVADQIAVGLVHTTKKSIEFSIESYFKTSNNLIEYKAGTILFDNAENFNNKIEIEGAGISKGIEILAQKKTGKFSGWVAYTISKTTREFENINGGVPYPFKYDRRHDLSIVTNCQLKTNINISATWVCSSEQALTLPTNKYQLPLMINSNSDDPNYPYSNIDIHVYDGKNSYRMPVYHRLDIGLNIKKDVKRGVRTWSLGVYNAYNKQNAYFVYFKQAPPRMIEQEDGSFIQVRDKNLKLYQVTLMPIFPYLSYNYSF